jgi:hypothetical protein
MMLQIENVKPIGVKGLSYLSDNCSVVMPPRGRVMERALSVTINI